VKAARAGKVVKAGLGDKNQSVKVKLLPDTSQEELSGSQYLLRLGCFSTNTQPKGGSHDCRDKDSTGETYIATVG